MGTTSKCQDLLTPEVYRLFLNMPEFYNPGIFNVLTNFAY